MSRYMWMLNSRSQDVYVSPYAIEGFEQSGETQCHLIMKSGLKILDIKTSAKDCAARVEEFIEKMEAEEDAAIYGCDCKCGEEVQKLSDESNPANPEEPAPIGEPQVFSPVVPDAPVTETPKDTNETKITPPEDAGGSDMGMGGMEG